MKKRDMIFYVGGIIVVLFIAGCGQNVLTDLNLDSFASCLTENGAEMYGASWCPHCTDQKELFGESFKLIDYTECTTDQQKCEEEGIQYLPTWKFADGTVTTGLKSFSSLAEKTGCKLP